MIARERPDPTALMLRFDRDGEEPERLRGGDSRDALVFAISMRLKHGRLFVGDKLSVLAAADDDID
jgi:hypothetical protein